MKDTAPALDVLDLDRHAFFFDFDGTLADFTDDPADVGLDARLGADLSRLYQRTGGAVAILTGRHRAEILVHVDFAIPVAGLHGTEFPGDVATHDPALAQEVAPLLPALSELVARYPGTLLEKKDHGFALHWRQAPHYEQEMIAGAEQAQADLGPAWVIQHGKFVAELRQAGGDKGTALRRFMAEPAFAGRLPVAFGDDLNDMPMLAAARELGGLAVCMGERDLPADHRLPGPAALATWLERRLA